MWPDKAIVILSGAESKNLKCPSEGKADLENSLAVFHFGQDIDEALQICLVEMDFRFLAGLGMTGRREPNHTCNSVLPTPVSPLGERH